MGIERRAATVLRITPQAKPDELYTPGRWYTTYEAADVAGVASDTISRHWCRRGLRSKAMPKGKRYLGEWLNEFLEADRKK